MPSFANLQLALTARTEAAQEKILYVITAYMDTQGLMPCRRESAERTVRIGREEDGLWAVFDDCADRLDIQALDGLGRCLTGKLRTGAVGVMGSGEGRMLRLYVDGRLWDTYLRAPAVLSQEGGGFPKGLRLPPRNRLGGRSRAIRWLPVLRPGHTVRELSDAFLRGTQPGLDDFRELLLLGRSAEAGFASVEEDGGAFFPGTVTLYFCTANRVRQGLLDRLLKPASRTAASTGALIRPARYRMWGA
ncbi:MAG TPA: hypothetical protein H9684_02295 [Firmicutes bacterium]|nr:hypothetical protein [Bacillota bacterium]